jgi:hypothetical protein
MYRKRLEIQGAGDIQKVGEPKLETHIGDIVNVVITALRQRLEKYRNNCSKNIRNKKKTLQY